MNTLDRKLEELRKYGFHQRGFPVEINGHVVEIVRNEGYEKEESNHIAVDYSLWCRNCENEHNVEGLIPECELFRLNTVQAYTLGPYFENECEQKV